MIKITIKKNKNFIEEIRIHGHAKYDEYGKDIVCAGVSSDLITKVIDCIIFDNESLENNEKNNFYIIYNYLNLKKVLVLLRMVETQLVVD